MFAPVRIDDDADRPEHGAAGVDDAVSPRKNPEVGYRNKEAKGAAPKRYQKHSSGDQGIQNEKKRQE